MLTCFALSVLLDGGAVDRIRGDIWGRGTTDRRCLRPPHIFGEIQGEVYPAHSCSSSLSLQKSYDNYLHFLIQYTWETIMTPYQVSSLGHQFRNNVADGPEAIWSYLMILSFHLFLSTSNTRVFHYLFSIFTTYNRLLSIINTHCYLCLCLTNYLLPYQLFF